MKKFYILLISIIFIFFSCNNGNEKNDAPEFKFSDSEFIVGLASPINLNIGTTLLRLKDYIPEKVEITGIITHEAIQYELSKDSLTLTLKVISDNLPKLSFLKISLVGIEYSILLNKSEKINYKISFDPKGKLYKSVNLKGEMNAWNPGNTPLKLVNGFWQAEFLASPGTYQYLFVIDGYEQLDLSNPEKISNGMGGFNSVLKIGTGNDSEIPVLKTASFQNNLIKITYKNQVSKLAVLYKNYELDERFISIKADTFEIIIPDDAKDQERTHIRIWAYNEQGISNDLLIPLHKGQVISDASQLTRFDFHSAVLYNAFVDRFFDGNPNNNRPTKNIAIHPRANYHGGDIQGITEKIKSGYFKNLGINTVWISPIVKNPETAWGLYPTPVTKFSAYHGYWPISFTLIDNRFGTEANLKELVKTAHENNINVLLDFVANHVHQDHPVYIAHKDWATNLYLPDGTLNTERWDDHRLTTWFDVFLPTLDLSKPEVYNMLSDSAVYWIEKYDLDGFRHDATKHIPEIFWQTLTEKLKLKIIIPEKRSLFQIGETYGTPELISSYVGTGQLDAQFDFNVYDAITRVLANNGNFKDLVQVIKTSQKYYGSHHLMGNITGNQDRGRFISYASGSLRFDEDAKKAGWTRAIEVIDSVGYKKCAMLNAIISTIPGIPVIYYGDEIGMPGGNDPDNRRMMRFDNLDPKEQDLKSITSKLLNFRKNSLALIYGDFKVIEFTEDILIYERTYFDKAAYIIINKGNTEQPISIYSNFSIDSKVKINSFSGNKIDMDSNKINCKISKNSFDIIYN